MNTTSFSLSVTDAPDATGRYHATLLTNPGLSAESTSRDCAAMALLLAALEAYPGIPESAPARAGSAPPK